MYILRAQFPFLIALSAAASPEASTRCYTPSIRWIDCSAENDTPGLKCANLSVPLDWSDPCNDETVRLALAMQPARSKFERVGALLFNTGGPGGQAVIELVGNGTGLIPFSEELRDKFDIVATDPRGIGQSQPVYCNHTLYNEMASLYPFPTTEHEYQVLYDASKQFGQSCLDMTGPLINHLDSITVAQDFEAVRVALGDEKLNYIGLSYGTVIGQAYLQMFPHNVRTMALDGVVDHTQRQTYTVLTEARTYEHVLSLFFDWCDSDRACAIHNVTLKSADLWENLIAVADRQPIPAPGCANPSAYCAKEVTGSELISKSQEGLLIQYPIRSAPDLDVISWVRLSQGLHDTYYTGDATPFSRTVSPHDNATEWNISISTFPALRNEQRLLATTAPHTRGICEFFGAMMQGLGWPLKPAYPEKATIFTNTAPVLLVNSYYDPETSYEWAVALQNEISNSVLLNRSGVGHTSYLHRGEAYRLTNEYLLSQKMPMPNMVVES